MHSVKDIWLHTEAFSPVCKSGDIDSFRFHSIKRIQSDTSFEPNVLYYGMESQVQTTLRYINDTILVLIRDIDKFYIPDKSNNCIVEYPENTTLDQLEHALTAALPSAQDILLEDSFQLFNSFLCENDISGILNSAAQLIHNPLIVIDVSYNVIAYSTCYDVNDEQWSKNIERGYCSFEYIAGFNEIEGVRNAPDSDEPFSIYCNTSPLRRCLSKLYHNGKFNGYLISIEAISSFEYMNMQFFQLISKTASKALDTANRIRRSNVIDVFDGVILDLLEGKILTPEHLRERLAQTNAEVFSSYQVLVFNIMSYTNYDYNSEFLRSLIKTMFPFSKIVSYKGDVVVLVDTAHTKEDIGDILRNHKKVLTDYYIRVGISDEGKSLFDIAKYYNQCQSALRIFSRFDPDCFYAFFNRYKFYIATLDEDLRVHPEDYYSKEFDLLHKYDMANNTQYMETLKSYISHQHKLDSVAADLFIHRNTASYRIRRIKELFDFDIEDSEFTFNFLYSYKLYKMKQLDLL